MAGRVRKLLDAIIEKRAQGNPTIASVTKTKLILKGLNPDHYRPDTPDDPVVLRRVEKLARHVGVKFSSL